MPRWLVHTRRGFRSTFIRVAFAVRDFVGARAASLLQPISVALREAFVRGARKLRVRVHGVLFSAAVPLAARSITNAAPIERHIVRNATHAYGHSNGIPIRINPSLCPRTSEAPHPLN